MKKPSLYRRFIMWIVDSWRLVMDTRYNPLKYIADPSLQTYFLLVLFTMWSVYFGFLATFYMGWLGYSIPISIGIHVLVILPIAFTNAVFMDAEKNGAQWVKDWRLEQMNWKFWQNRPSKRGKNIIHWDIDKEA
tara:strand:+ start:1634 stop:2035 length:402 start_codon:yes stop_codon:yes gene_type:complete